MSFQKLERQLVEARKGCIELAQAKADMPLHQSTELPESETTELAEAKFIQACRSCIATSWLQHMVLSFKA